MTKHSTKRLTLSSVPRPTPPCCVVISFAATLSLISPSLFPRSASSKHVICFMQCFGADSSIDLCLASPAPGGGRHGCSLALPRSPWPHSWCFHTGKVHRSCRLSARRSGLLPVSVNLCVLLKLGFAGNLAMADDLRAEGQRRARWCVASG